MADIRLDPTHLAPTRYVVGDYARAVLAPLAVITPCREPNAKLQMMKPAYDGNPRNNDRAPFNKTET